MKTNHRVWSVHLLSVYTIRKDFVYHWKVLFIGFYCWMVSVQGHSATTHVHFWCFILLGYALSALKHFEIINMNDSCNSKSLLWIRYIGLWCQNETAVKNEVINKWWHCHCRHLWEGNWQVPYICCPFILASYSGCIVSCSMQAGVAIDQCEFITIAYMITG